MPRSALSSDSRRMHVSRLLTPALAHLAVRLLRPAPSRPQHDPLLTLTSGPGHLESWAGPRYARTPRSARSGRQLKKRGPAGENKDDGHTKAVATHHRCRALSECHKIRRMSGRPPIGNRLRTGQGTKVPAGGSLMVCKAAYESGLADPQPNIGCAVAVRHMWCAEATKHESVR